MKRIFEAIEKVLETIEIVRSDVADWFSSILPESMKGLCTKYPRLSSLLEDIKCLAYFTFLRVILTVVLLPSLLVALPVLGLWKLCKNCFKKKEA